MNISEANHKKNIKKYKRSCMGVQCKSKAFVEDNGGWTWCVKHFLWIRKHDKDNYFSKFRKFII